MKILAELLRFFIGSQPNRTFKCVLTIPGFDLGIIYFYFSIFSTLDTLFGSTLVI